MAVDGRMLDKWRQRLVGGQDALGHLRDHPWLCVRLRGRG